MTISRMLAAMLATAALVTPTASASMLDGSVDIHQPLIEQEQKQERKQDLRMPDRRDAESPAMKKLRVLGPPTWPAYPTPDVPPAPSKPVATTTSDDGINWATIGIGVGLSVALVCAIGAVSLRVRRRERVAT
jgi:hypothetical protein